jgi:hypothetical protein
MREAGEEAEEPNDEPDSEQPTVVASEELPAVKSSL